MIPSYAPSSRFRFFEVVVLFFPLPPLLLARPQCLPRFNVGIALQKNFFGCQYCSERGYSPLPPPSFPVTFLLAPWGYVMRRYSWSTVAVKNGKIYKRNRMEREGGGKKKMSRKPGTFLKVGGNGKKSSWTFWNYCKRGRNQTADEFNGIYCRTK